jgi:hypothetical protein
LEEQRGIRGQNLLCSREEQASMRVEQADSYLARSRNSSLPNLHAASEILIVEISVQWVALVTHQKTIACKKISAHQK